MKPALIFFMCLLSSSVFADEVFDAVGEAVIPELRAEMPMIAQSKNDIAIDTKTVTLWQEYFTKLNDCTPGTFVLPQINPHLAKQYGNILTARIDGALNGHCEVIMMYYSENDSRLKRNPQSIAVQQYPTGQECRLSKATANAMIEFDSNVLKGNEVKIANDDPHSKAMMEECTPFVMVDGEKILG